jgi:hypothetical protein
MISPLYKALAFNSAIKNFGINTKCKDLYLKNAKTKTTIPDTKTLSLNLNLKPDL